MVAFEGRQDLRSHREEQSSPHSAWGKCMKVGISFSKIGPDITNSPSKTLPKLHLQL